MSEEEERALRLTPHEMLLLICAVSHYIETLEQDPCARTHQDLLELRRIEQKAKEAM
jgi:hypothetical protein